MFSSMSHHPSVSESAPAISFNEAEITELHSLLDKAVLAMDAPREYLRALLGPEPGQIGGPLLAQMNAGAGHFRHCRDTIRRLWRARNEALAVAQEASK